MKATNLALFQTLPSNHSLPVARRILHPTDLTVISDEAFATAIKFARQNDAVLFIVHALPPPTPIYEIESSVRPEAEEALAKLLKRVTDIGVKAKRVLIKGSGPVSNNIVRCARFFGADLIVMGTSGRTGISRWLVGSHASRVVARAHCPVVIVRGQSARMHSSRRT
jgi:nucleotide-binding universal stress UspA family protein